jgi:tetratricopeptide (TPR) repeat protein
MSSKVKLLLLLASTSGQTLGQNPNTSAPIGDLCVELNRTAMTQAANGKLKEAELALTAFLASGANQAQPACAGIVLNNMAALLSVSGRSEDGARLAERAVQTLEKAYFPNDPALLPPLQILASASFELGMIGKAREAFKRMQSIRVQRPEDHALLYGMAAALSEAEGKLPDAEANYLAALQEWQKAGRGETAEAGAILCGLGSLYLKEHRLSEARQALDRALAIFGSARMPSQWTVLNSSRFAACCRRGRAIGRERNKTSTMPLRWRIVSSGSIRLPFERY